MGHGAFGDHQTTGLQALMHLRDAPVFSEAPEANESHDIQAKFAMRQRPASFFLRVRAHMIARTSGGVALTTGASELEDPLQGDHLPPSVVRHPQGMVTLGTGPLKRPQGSCELRVGFGGSPCHRLPPCFNKGQLYPLSVHLLSSGVCRSAFFLGWQTWGEKVLLQGGE